MNIERAVRRIVRSSVAGTRHLQLEYGKAVDSLVASPAFTDHLKQAAGVIADAAVDPDDHDVFVKAFTDRMRDTARSVLVKSRLRRVK